MANTTPRTTSDHLANERTFLAWVRTAIGIMAFGFVVVKFSLFVRQFELLVHEAPATPHKGYSAMIGVVLVAGGMLISILAFMRYKETEKKINAESYKSSSILLTLLTGFLVLISILLIAYLVQTT